MKFAFSTVACPTWDFSTIVNRARQWGYGGIEIRGFLNETALTSADVFLTDPQKLRRLFADAGVHIACLAGSVQFTGKRRRDQQQAGDLRQYIATAEQIGCPLVKIFDTQVRAGQTRSSAGSAMGDWLLPLGDFAANHGVTIVVENALSFRAAKEFWLILDRTNHPAVACCWDVFNAAVIGEPPALSVPVLNSKIQYAHVKDARLGATGASYCKLGEGDVPVEDFIHRLMGIGYDGYVTMEWEKAWLPGLADAAEVLPDALTKLRKWAGKPALEPAPDSDAAPAAPPPEGSDAAEREGAAVA